MSSFTDLVLLPSPFALLVVIKVDTVFMDSVAPVAEAPIAGVSQELAREALMAISQSIPEKNPSNPLPTNYTDANGVNVKENVEAEEYRSKLISISYTESSDVQPTPSALENLRS